MDEWEAASRSDIRLPEKQLAVVAQIIEKNPNVVVTVYSGRPLDLQGIDVAKELCKLGNLEQKGQCASRNFVGTVQSSGRLSMSFPETVGQVPIFTMSTILGVLMSQHQKKNMFLNI